VIAVAQQAQEAFEAENLPTVLALATADLLFRWHDDKDDWDLPFDTLLSRLTNPT
jgi:hypothetical protein